MVPDGIWLCVLGPFRVQYGGDVQPVSAAKHRILLATLLMNAGRVVSGDVLADTIWDGAPPPSARVTIRGNVKQLRQKLPPAVAARIVTGSAGYLIELADDELDLSSFSNLYRQAGVAVRRTSWGRRTRSWVTRSACGRHWRTCPRIRSAARMYRR